MKRYSKIETKNKREIVLLQGLGCRYKKCCFCDYYLDTSSQREELNTRALSCVSGAYGVLEVINSGSFGELSQETLNQIIKIAKEKKIKTLIFECHYLYRKEIQKLREFFGDIEVKVKLGLETFDYHLRECVMHKGIDEQCPKTIAQEFNEANFLVGIKGQSKAVIELDLKLGLQYFERICVNVMCDNSKMKADQAVIAMFLQEIYPLYAKCERIDFLLENTDFGVG